jgi:hypothetical protein
VCGEGAPYGFGPPGFPLQPAEAWYCGTHREEGERVWAARYHSSSLGPAVLLCDFTCRGQVEIFDPPRRVEHHDLDLQEPNTTSLDRKPGGKMKKLRYGAAPVALLGIYGLGVVQVGFSPVYVECLQRQLCTATIAEPIDLTERGFSTNSLQIGSLTALVSGTSGSYFSS